MRPRIFSNYYKTVTPVFDTGLLFSILFPIRNCNHFLGNGTAFRRYFDLGRLVRSVLPLGNGRLMHWVVAYGFQGADDDAEKLSLSDQLFDAAMCELAVVSRGQPCVIAGDINVEPTKVPCLLKGISAGLWVDVRLGLIQMLLASEIGLSLSGLEGTFVLGCPLAAAALGGCWVDGCRWIQPHPSVCASFCGCLLVC